MSRSTIFGLALGATLMLPTACLMGPLLSPAHAADIRVEAGPGSGPVTIYLEGRIGPSDLAMMELRLDQIAKQKPRPEIIVALNSPGGDHFQGLRIGLLLRRSGVGTVVLPGKSCWSACSSIFFGGYDLKAGRPNRVAYSNAQIGVHQMAPTSGTVPDHVHKRVFNAAKQFLTDVEVSSRIQDKLFETSPWGMYILTTADMAESNISIRAAN